MSRTQIKSKKHDQAIKPRVKVWLEFDGEFVFGLGICEILQAIERTGSMKQAAREVGQSYRHVWGRIKDVEQAHGCALVVTQVGGKDARRSTLTENARQLVTGFLALRKRMHELLEREFDNQFGSVRKTE
jgi:molybdate transport system regulatory protein